MFLFIFLESTVRFSTKTSLQIRRFDNIEAICIRFDVINIINNYCNTSKEVLSSGVTEHFILMQLARIKAREILSGPVKTLY